MLKLLDTDGRRLNYFMKISTKKEKPQTDNCMGLSTGY